jgi:anti-anti-sigma regulatory factor
MLAFLEGRTRSTGQRLRIQNPSAHVRELLELTNLDSVIEITPSRQFQEICEAIQVSDRGELPAAVANP